MIVMKFGGSSVQDAAAINSVAGIVAARAGRKPVVVVSLTNGASISEAGVESCAGVGEEGSLGTLRE